MHASLSLITQHDSVLYITQRVHACMRSYTKYLGSYVHVCSYVWCWWWCMAEIYFSNCVTACSWKYWITHVIVITRGLLCCQAFAECWWVYFPAKTLVVRGHWQLHPAWEEEKTLESHTMGIVSCKKMHWRSFPLLAIHTTFQLADHCNCTRPWFILNYSYLHVLTFLLVCALCFWMCPHSCVGLHHTPAPTVSQYCHPSLNILILDIQRKVLDGEVLLSKDLRKTFVKENRFRHLRYNNYTTH